MSISKFPVVIKSDGLAKGKGVFICHTLEDVERHIDDIMKEKIFGSAGNKVVIEEFLVGEEVSILAITDGNTIVPLSTAQDHKAVYDGDKGPNTGGMGVYSPVPMITAGIQSFVEENILVSIVHAMKRESRPYKGVIYAGLIITGTGPKVLEFNARFGDPETQALLVRMKSDIVPLLYLRPMAARTWRRRRWNGTTMPLSASLWRPAAIPAAMKKGFLFRVLKRQRGWIRYRSFMQARPKRMGSS